MKCKLLLMSFLLFFGINSQAQTQTAGKNPVEEKTNAVAIRLNLDGEKKTAINNIFTQTEKRITDLAQGTPDYTKLINYINTERSEMLKVALSPEEFSNYQKFFTARDNAEINTYIKNNNVYLTKKTTAELKEKKETDKIMQADKVKLAKEEEKAKIAAKKAADKQKIADKKAADKLKADAKKEKIKQKAADKKEAERLKKENAKQKAIDKKNADTQKALEKKQKELDKKLNKK